VLSTTEIPYGLPAYIDFALERGVERLHDTEIRP
jgi:hypothetical protein